MIESLILLIADAQKRGKITGIRVTPNICLTHLLFVDDVLLFGLGTLEEWQGYKEVLDLFCSATSMTISVEKSSFLFSDIEEGTREQILSLLPYSMEPITTGFKYLSYRLKPLGYCTNDWHWIVKNFERRISN